MSRRRTPTPEQVAALVDALDTLLRRTAGGMRHRIVVQMQRDHRGGSAVPDGYPRATLGNGGAIGGSGGTTEAAAFARLESPEDEHHRLTWRSWQVLESVLVELQNVHAWLAQLEAAGRQVAPDDDAWCENHLRHGVTEPRDVANRRRTCRWCYDVQHAYGSLPNAALIERRARGERMTEQGVAAALGLPVRKAG